MKKIISAVLTAAVLMSVMTSAAYAGNAGYFRSEISEIESLIQNCRDKGISTDYEDVCLATMQRFAGYIEDDEAAGYNSSLIAYDKQAMLDMYNETKSNLNAYLSGMKEPLNANLADMRDLSNDGFTLFEKGKPVYSIGYGHFNTAMEDVENFRGFGANNIQLECGPSKVQPIENDNLASWMFVKEISSGTCSEEITSSSVTEGKSSLKISVQDSKGRIYQNLFLERGYDYKLSFDIRGSKGLSVKVHWGDYVVPVDYSGNWRSIAIDINKKNVSNHLPFYISAEGSGTLFIDNIKACKKNESDSYIINGGFEDELYSENISLILKTLAKASDSNVGVSVLLSPHLFPKNLTGENIYSDSPEFIQYIVDAPVPKGIIEDYLRYFIPIISKYSSVTNICLSNEPLYDTRYSPNFYNPKFRDYLAEKYGTIAKINSLYGTSYSDFSDTQMPTIKTPNHINMSEPLAYDWVLFNRSIFADWHKWMADIIKEYTDIPLNTKMGNYMGWYTTNEWLATAGTDAELYSEFLDWSGNDAAAYIDDEGSLIRKLMWYDYLRSVTNKPVYNSEDHIIEDRNFEFSEHQTKNLVNDLWQGAIHGRAMSTIWVWERSYSTKDAYSGSILIRPDCVWQAGKTGLDLSRLSEYIKAINADKRKTAIYYSSTSAIYDNEYLGKIESVYKNLLTLGEKVDFVTENTLGKLSEYDTVIAYGTGYASNDVLKAFYEYEKSGKKVICQKNDFGKNEYAKSTDGSRITSNATIAYESNLRKVLSDGIERRLIVVDNQTGTESHNIEYEYSVNENRVVLNMTGMTYGTNNDVSVYLDGKKLVVGTELIKNVPYEEKITVNGLEPVMLSFDIRKNTEAPGQVKQIKVTADGMLSWKNSGEYTYSTLIYDEASNSLIAESEENKVMLPKFGTYRLRAKSFAGMFSNPMYVTYADGNIFEVGLSDISYRNGKAHACVDVKNTTADKVYGATKVVVLDAAGKEIASACVEGLYNGNGRKSFSVDLVCEGAADSISATVMSTRVAGIKYSESYTAKISELVQ